MNTKKQIPLNGTQVERATRLFRAYKHPYRYEIINSLLLHGSLTADELASFVGMAEAYILEQLDILTASDLVFAELSDKGMLFSANEDILVRMKNSVRNLA